MVANVIEGFSGGMPTMVMATYAYLVNTCDSKDLTKRIVGADIACGFVFSISQILLGFAISALGYMWPFLMLIGLHLLNVLYLLVFVADVKNKHTAEAPSRIQVTNFK